MCNSYMAATMSSPVTDTALNIKTTLMRDDIDLDARVITTISLKKNNIWLNFHFSSLHWQIF